MILTLTKIADVVRANVHPDQLYDLKVHPQGCVTYQMDEMYRYWCTVTIRDGKICDISRLSPDGDASEQTFDASTPTRLSSKGRSDHAFDSLH